jgi:hypothetical protein
LFAEPINLVFPLNVVLRRRGVPSVPYDVQFDERNGLSAHVWVRDGEVNVIDGGFSPLRGREMESHKMKL